MSMFSLIKKTDHFTKNVIFVFLGTSLANFLNLVYQLLIAHKLSAQDFASFNALLAIFTIISTPLGTLQIAVAKYASEYSARKQTGKIDALISGLFNRSLILSVLLFVLFVFISPCILNSLKINSLDSGYILAILIAFSLLIPFLTGALQGLELFGWLVTVPLCTGIVKIATTIILIHFGYKISGALGALLISVIFGIIVSLFPLRKSIFLKNNVTVPNYREVVLFLLPVAIVNLCFVWLTSFDMVLVKYFFSAEASGAYSLPQMLGKIFLFLPSAISVVMFPRTSGLMVLNSETESVLNKSLLYTLCLCLIAALFYNVFPGFTFKVLTGKVLPESILLGRLFSFSMTFFALCFVLINYFLSIKDLIFMKYMFFSAVFQFTGILLFHHSLVGVQLVLCVNSFLTFVLLYSKLKSKVNS